MKARPILFSAPMVRALLYGRKTQTRRVMKPQPAPADGWDWSWPLPAKHVTRGTRVYWRADSLPGTATTHHYCPYGKPGDLLWVRETWSYDPDTQNGPVVSFRASAHDPQGRWRPSIHMPRWASRITLRIKGVRVQRLQDISEDDAEAEGVDAISQDDVRRQAAFSRRHDFSRLWELINGAGSWDANPWVWALMFEVIKRNVDALDEEGK